MSVRTAVVRRGPSRGARRRSDRDGIGPLSGLDGCRARVERHRKVSDRAREPTWRHPRRARRSERLRPPSSALGVRVVVIGGAPSGGRVDPRARGCARCRTSPSPAPRRRRPPRARSRPSPNASTRCSLCCLEGLAGKQVARMLGDQPEDRRAPQDADLFEARGNEPGGSRRAGSPSPIRRWRAVDGTCRVCKGLPPSLARDRGRGDRGSAGSLVHDRGRLQRRRHAHPFDTRPMSSSSTHAENNSVPRAEAPRASASRRWLPSSSSRACRHALPTFRVGTSRPRSSLLGGRHRRHRHRHPRPSPPPPRTARRAERMAAAFARGLKDYLADQSRIDLRLQIRGLEQQIAGTGRRTRAPEAATTPFASVSRARSPLSRSSSPPRSDSPSSSNPMQRQPRLRASRPRHRGPVAS